MERVFRAWFRILVKRVTKSGGEGVRFAQHFAQKLPPGCYPRLNHAVFRACTALWVALAPLLLASCSGGGRQPVYAAHGQVFDSNQKPAVGAVVMFHPVKPVANDLAKPVGHVDQQGVFTLTTYKKGDGAPEGEYVVTVEWRPPKKTPLDPDPPDLLRGEYGNPKTSTLRARIERKDNTLEPFVVKAPR